MRIEAPDASRPLVGLDTSAGSVERELEALRSVAGSIADIATLGTASFLLNRARAQVQMAAYEWVRDNVCWAPPAEASLGTAGADRCSQLGADRVRCELATYWLRNTCALVGTGRASGTQQSAYGSFARGLQSALLRDVLDLPVSAARRLATLNPGEQGAGGLLLELLVQLVAELIEDPEPVGLATALSELAHAGAQQAGLSPNLAVTCPAPQGAAAADLAECARRQREEIWTRVKTASDQFALVAAVARAERLGGVELGPSMAQTLLEAAGATGGMEQVRLQRLHASLRDSYGHWARVADSDATSDERRAAVVPALRLTISGLEIAVNPDRASTDPTESILNEIFASSARIIDLVDAVSAGDFPRVIALFAGLWNGVLPSTLEPQVALAPGTARSLNAGTGTSATRPGTLRDTVIPPQALRLMTIIAELATAQTPDEFEAALQIVSAPIGSSSLKRQGFRLSLGGVVGVLGGMEYAFATELTPPSDGFSNSVILGVGLDLSFGYTAGYFSFFINVIDLGAFATWNDLDPARESSADEFELCEQDPTDNPEMEEMMGETCYRAEDVSLARVFAPGLLMRIAPFTDASWITLGLGFTIHPFGRQYSSEVSADVDIVSARVFAFVAVDVPVLFF